MVSGRARPGPPDDAGFVGWGGGLQSCRLRPQKTRALAPEGARHLLRRFIMRWLLVSRLQIASNIETVWRCLRPVKADPSRACARGRTASRPASRRPKQAGTSAPASLRRRPALANNRPPLRAKTLGNLLPPQGIKDRVAMRRGALFLQLSNAQ